MPALHQAFNLAFDNYFVDMEMDFETFENRFLVKEKIDLSLSGAFFSEKDEILAFILHAVEFKNGVKTAYNAGTGVIPDFRGKKLTTALYSELINTLKEQAVEAIQLEVITENHPAIKAYENVGFQKKRTLHFYNSDTGPALKKNTRVTPTDFKSTLDFNLYSDYTPSWPCQPSHLAAIKNQLACYAYQQDDLLQGYAVANLKSGRIHFLGVHEQYRRQGIGTALLKQLAEDAEKPLTVLNVPSSATVVNRFLEKMTFEVKINQYEMKYALS